MPAQPVARVQTSDYPGLLRLIAWLLNGLDIRVARAKLHTSQDGIVKDLFWVTDSNGKKVVRPQTLAAPACSSRTAPPIGAAAPSDAATMARSSNSLIACPSYT